MGAPEQVTQAELALMRPEQIEAARADGRLAELLAGGADQGARGPGGADHPTRGLGPEEIMRRLRAGELDAYLAEPR